MFVRKAIAAVEVKYGLFSFPAESIFRTEGDSKSNGFAGQRDGRVVFKDRIAARGNLELVNVLGLHNAESQENHRSTCHRHSYLPGS